MRTDTRWDRFLLWVASRAPYGMSQRLLWRVQDHRLDHAMASRERVAKELRRRR